MTEPRYKTDHVNSPQADMRIVAVASFRPEELSQTVQEMTVPVELITVEPSPGRLGHIFSLYRQLERAIELQDPDVILLDCFETMGVVATVVAQRAGIPVVARLVGDTWRGYETPALSDVSTPDDLVRFSLHRASLALDKFIFERTDGFVTVSNELRETVCQRTDSAPGDVEVVPVPMTVDTLHEGSPRECRQRLDVDEEKVVLTVTNLKFPEKFEGIKTVLSELEPVLRTDPNVAYVIAGGGRFRDPLRSLLDTEYAHIREQIYAVGHVDTVSDLYTFADVFVYVSYRDGYPNVVLEAQTAELPVIANSEYGMVDQITDNETGYLVAPENEGQLRSHVQRLLQSPDERQRLGRNARQRVLEENTQSEIAIQLQEALQSILTQERTA